jgi:hypothetical protein
MARNSRRFWLHHVANPPNTLAKAVAWVGVTSGGGLVWLNIPTAYNFCDDFSKLTCDLGLFILESFSGFKARSFEIFWDLGRWLIIEGQ